MTYLSKIKTPGITPPQRIVFVACLPMMLAGCAGFFEKPTPAPVFQGGGAKARIIPEPVYPSPGTAQQEPPTDTGTTVEIKPLPSPTAIEAKEIKPEPIPSYQDSNGLLTPEQEQELAEFERAQNTRGVTTPTEAPASAGTAPIFPPNVEAPVTPPPPPFEPLQDFGLLSPAVGALVLAANKNTDQGNIESATTTIERAIRIEPRNAALYYKLALLRLEQNKPKLAEGLAKKSALLASGGNPLKKHSWLLIAKARDMQNNPQGAQEARAQAEKY